MWFVLILLLAMLASWPIAELRERRTAIIRMDKWKKEHDPDFIEAMKELENI